jgi:hypothetical protein
MMDYYVHNQQHHPMPIQSHQKNCVRLNLICSLSMYIPISLRHRLLIDSSNNLEYRDESVTRDVRQQGDTDAYAGMNTSERREAMGVQQSVDESGDQRQ